MNLLIALVMNTMTLGGERGRPFRNLQALKFRSAHRLANQLTSGAVLATLEEFLNPYELGTLWLTCCIGPTYCIMDFSLRAVQDSHVATFAL